MSTTQPGPGIPGRSHPQARSPAQLAALLYGIVFLLVGIAGFIPGITTNVGSMQLGGHHSEAMLLGIFQLSVLHNIVHLLYGIAGLVLSRLSNTARSYLLRPPPGCAGTVGVTAAPPR